MNIEPEIIAALIGGSVGVLGTILTNIALRGKNKADISLAISAAAANLINPLNDRIEKQQLEIKDLARCTDKQEEEIKTLKTRLASFLQGIKKLIGQLREKGCEPVWVPEELTLKTELRAKGKN